jgi:hypothetical protein
MAAGLSGPCGGHLALVELEQVFWRRGLESASRVSDYRP